MAALVVVAGCATPGVEQERAQSPTPTKKPSSPATPSSKLSIPGGLTEDGVCGLVSKAVLKRILGVPVEVGGLGSPNMHASSAGCEWRNRTPEGEGAGKQRNLKITVWRYRPGPDSEGKDYTAVQWAQGAYYQSFQTARENEGTTEKVPSGKNVYGRMTKIPGIGDQNYVMIDMSQSSVQRNRGVLVYIQIGDSTVRISYRGYNQAPGGRAYDPSGNKPMSARAARAGGVAVAKDIMTHVVKG